MYVLYGFLAAGCFVSAGMSLTEVYFGAGLDSGWLQNAVFSIALAFSFLARREREKEDGVMHATSRIEMLDPRCAIVEVFIVGDGLSVRATRRFDGEYAHSDADLWAEAQKPRVEAAWAALTGGEAE